MRSQQLHQKTFTRVITLLFPSMFISMFVFSACSSGNTTTISSTPTPTIAAAQLTSPAILPRGLHEILYLTNKSKSVVNVGGAFYASHPYVVYALCSGSGKLTVQYAPGGSSTFLCSPAGQLYGNYIGDTQHPPTPENLHVQVTLDGKAVWEVSIQWQA